MGLGFRVRPRPGRFVKAASDQFSDKRLSELLSGAEESFKAAFLLLIEHIGDSVDLQTVEQAMVSGDLGMAIASTEKLAMGLSGVWAEVFGQAGDEAAKFISDYASVPVRFDLVNDRAVAAMKDAQLRLIQQISGEQRDLIRDILTRGIQSGENPRVVAQEIRDSIGLTRYQEQIVANYRDQLEQASSAALDRELRDARFDPKVRSAAEAGKPLPAADIDRMVGRYRDNWISYRAEVIARTEGLRAATEGIHAGFQQAVEDGDIQEQEVKRTWITRHDSRTRISHIEMDRQERGLNEPFVDGDGNLLMYPRDPAAPPETTIQCRCRVTVRLV